MKIFAATPYSSKVDWNTGEVDPQYANWVEGIFTAHEKLGHTIISALRQDNYKVNHLAPDEAFNFDFAQVSSAGALVAILTGDRTDGTQQEIGYAYARGMQIVLAHEATADLGYFCNAGIAAGAYQEVIIPPQTTLLAVGSNALVNAFDGVYTPTN